MRQFLRALRMALTYRWSLAISIVCSMLVAVLWGANIGAVYPFVEVVFRGQSLHEWIDQRVEISRQSAADAQREVDQLRAQLDAAEDPAAQRRIQRQIELRSSLVDAELRKAEGTERLRPYIERWAPTTPFSTLIVIALFLMVGTLLRGLFLMASMVTVARVGQRTVLDLQNKFFSRTLQMDLRQLGSKGTGDLISRIRGETNHIGMAIITLFGKTIREPMKMFACLAGAALVNWRLLLLSLIVCPLAAYLMLRLARLTKRANRRAIEESARLLDRLFQALTYMKLVQAFTMEGHERRRFRSVAHDVYRRAMRISVYTSLARMNNEILGIGIIAVALVAGGYLVLNREMYLLGIRLCNSPMTFGEIMVFFAFLIGVSDPIRKMGDTYTLLQTGFVAAERVFPLVDRQPQVQSPAKGTAKQLPERALDVEFANVSFGYVPETLALDQVTLRIDGGSTIALVGPNGCGKSTLLNLVPRFYDPDSGCIRIAGNDIRDYRLRDLRRRIAYVTQQTMLFDDTIANNIRYGAMGATLEEIQEAARRAYADEFIQRLPDGYHSRIGEHGGRLSGGQRQRLSLARAFLRNPAILVLDEATSQIDPESEQLIHQALAEFMRGRTVLLVTHRMSTVDLADEIVVMDQGRIVDSGTNSELEARCPLYRRLRRTELREAA